MKWLDKIRASVRSVMRRLAQKLDRLTGGSVSPNTITIAGALMHIAIALLIATQHTLWAAIFLIVFGLLDTLDGELARLQNRTSARGMLLDSVTDRMKEVVLYSGVAYNIIASTGRPYLAVWVVAAVGASIVVSYINAWGEVTLASHGSDKHEVNKTLRGGIASFEIRMFILVVGLVTNRLALTAIVITVLASYNALERLARIYKKLG